MLATSTNKVRPAVVRHPGRMTEDVMEARPAAGLTVELRLPARNVVARTLENPTHGLRALGAA